MQVPEVELPAVALTAAVLAHQPVQPALDPAGELEVGRVDGEHACAVQYAGVEPVGQDQFDAQGPAIGRSQFPPFVDPRETVQAPPAGFADRGGHAGGLQPVQGGPQALVVPRRGAATDEAQDLVGRGAYQPGG